MDICRDDLLAGIRSLVAPPLTEDDRLPDGYETLDAAEILSEDERAELHQRQRWSPAIRRRFPKQ